MTVLKRHHASDMAAEEYDEIAALVREPQSKADGFVAHYAVVEVGGVTAFEIWDSIAQHDAWFTDAVQPLLPPGHV
jgi:predicted urease superfamily metal-dependent hydrolase